MVAGRVRSRSFSLRHSLVSAFLFFAWSLCTYVRVARGRESLFVIPGTSYTYVVLHTYVRFVSLYCHARAEYTCQRGTCFMRPEIHAHACEVQLILCRIYVVYMSLTKYIDGTCTS